MNNNGPNIEPCATPIETGAISEVTCFLCVKNEVNRAMADHQHQDFKTSEAILYD